MKKCLIVLSLLLDFFCLEATTNVPLVKPCGLGTPECPYKIGTPGELLYFAEVVNDLLDSIPHNLGACAVLTNDIDLSEVCGPEIGGWTSIGYYNNEYSGIFDGRNHRIENLYVYADDVIRSDAKLAPLAYSGRGFFGCVYNGTIRNLTIGSGYLYVSSEYVGSLGSIVGSASGTIYNCHNYATVEGDCLEVTVGGIVGVQSCVGDKPIVEKCSNAGYVKGNFYTGGITGSYGCGATRNCYNIGIVEGNGYVGGIVASHNYSNTKIENCYSFGKIIQNNPDRHKVAGIVPQKDTEYVNIVTNCYYNNSGTPTDDKNDLFHAKEDFKNGTIFHKLDSLYPGVWTQNLGVDSLPIFIEDNLLEQEEYIHKVKYICKGDSFEYNGKFYKETGIYPGECEDCAELYLKVLGEDTTKLSVSIEEGGSYQFGDELLTESGVYTRVVETHLGCDSIVYLELTVLKPEENHNPSTTVPLVKPCGLGTPECPYKIGTPGELLYFAEVVNDLLDSIPHNPGACAVLTNDIDLSEVCGPEIGSWTSIGYYNCNYQGTFDGRNHRIENLYLYSTDVIKSDIELEPEAAWSRGFFGIVYNGSIRNLIIGSGYLYTNKGDLGAVAGCVSGGTVYNCHNFASVEGDCSRVGGVVGLEGCGGMTETKVEKCSNAGKVSGTSIAGGIIGGFGCGVTRNCYNIGTVEGRTYVGGVVGRHYITTIENCYSFGDVILNKKEYSYSVCGGIVGDYSVSDSRFIASDCYCNNPSASVENNKEFFSPKEDFKNGTVFHKLDSLYPGVWTQNVGVDSLPIFIEDNLLEQEEYIHKVKYICQGDSFEYNGKFYKETGIYHGECEDCSELYLKVLGEDTTKLSETIEEGDSYQFGDELLTEPGIYTRVVENHLGCDSVISLNLQIIHVCKPVTYDIFGWICEGQNYYFEGTSYSKTGRYVKKYVNSFGCDSFVVLNLNVQPMHETFFKATINQGESYNYDNFSVPVQDKPGVFSYKQNFVNQNGCDSIVYLELTVLKVEENNTDTLPEIEEPEDIPIYIPEIPEHSEIETTEIEIPNIFTPYTEDGINDVFMENYTVYIYDRYGNLVCHSDNGWDGKYKGELADPGTYVYVLTLKNGEKKKGTIKVLKLK